MHEQHVVDADDRVVFRHPAGEASAGFPVAPVFDPSEWKLPLVFRYERVIDCDLFSMGAERIGIGAQVTLAPAL